MLEARLQRNSSIFKFIELNVIIITLTCSWDMRSIFHIRLINRIRIYLFESIVHKLTSSVKLYYNFHLKLHTNFGFYVPQKY